MVIEIRYDFGFVVVWHRLDPCRLFEIWIVSNGEHINVLTMVQIFENRIFDVNEGPVFLVCSVICLLRELLPVAKLIFCLVLEVHYKVVIVNRWKQLWHLTIDNQSFTERGVQEFRVGDSQLHASIITQLNDIGLRKLSFDSLNDACLCIKQCLVALQKVLEFAISEVQADKRLLFCNIVPGKVKIIVVHVEQDLSSFEAGSHSSDCRVIIVTVRFTTARSNGAYFGYVCTFLFLVCFLGVNCGILKVSLFTGYT